MSSRRGRWVAIGVGVAALAVVAVAAWPLVREEILLRRLESPSLPAKLAAARELAEMGSARAIPHVLEQWSHTEESNSTPDRVQEQWRDAASRLMNPRTFRRVGEWIATLSEEPGYEPVSWLSETLWDGAEEHPEARALLAEMAASPFSGVRIYAVSALIGQNEWALPLLRAAAVDADESVRASASLALARLGGAGKPAAAALRGRLATTTDLWEFSRVAFALELMGTETFPLLAARLADPDPGIRAEAVALIGGLGPRAFPTVPDLLALLEDSDEGLALASYMALTSIGAPAAAAGLDELYAFARTHAGDGADELRLARLGAAVIPLLVRSLAAADREERRFAARVLEAVGEPASAAVPQLIEACSSEDAGLADAALRALCRVGMKSEAAIRVLVREVSLGGPRGQIAAVALLRADPTHGAARKLLREAHRAGTLDVEPFLCIDPSDPAGLLGRGGVTGNLLRHVVADGGWGAPTLQALEAVDWDVGRLPNEAVKLLQADARAEARSAGGAIPGLAGYSIGCIAESPADTLVAVALLGERALPALQPLLASADPLAQAIAAQVLYHLGPSGKAAAPDLARLLDSSNQDVARSALEALAQMGHPARAVREAVQRCAQRHPALRRQIRDVLWLLDWLHDPARPYLTRWWDRSSSEGGGG